MSVILELHFFSINFLSPGIRLLLPWLIALLDSTHQAQPDVKSKDVLIFKIVCLAHGSIWTSLECGGKFDALKVINTICTSVILQHQGKFLKCLIPQ